MNTKKKMSKKTNKRAEIKLYKKNLKSIHYTHRSISYRDSSSCVFTRNSVNIEAMSQHIFRIYNK